MSDRTPDPAPEPLTEAGRILLREHSSGTPHMARHIVSIEIEAADLFAKQIAARPSPAETPVADLRADDQTFWLVENESGGYWTGAGWSQAWQDGRKFTSQDEGGHAASAVGQTIAGSPWSVVEHGYFAALHTPAPRVASEGLRDWQRDLLTPDADGLMLDQVVADLLGVKSVNLRTEQDDDGTPTSEDCRWRVQFFGGTYGGTLRAALNAETPEPIRGHG